MAANATAKTRADTPVLKSTLRLHAGSNVREQLQVSGCSRS